MKLRNLAMYLLIAGGLSASCIKEDVSDCYNTYRLALSYQGDGTTEIFPEKIASVDLYVFDDQKNCVYNAQLPEEDVKNQLTTLPPLDAGDYRIVCVGNAYDTKIVDLDAKDHNKTSFAAADHINGETVSGNDPLYWSAIDYTIQPYDVHKGIETHTTYFASSHYDLIVEVVGVEPATKASGYPSIEVTGVSPYTDFTNRAYGTATYVMETSHDGGNLLGAASNIMRHKNHEDVNVVLKSGDTVLATVNIADHVAQHNINTSLHECVIPIRIEFSTIGVEVTVPGWYIQGVYPEF
jgi:hypothetical protein